MQTAKRMTPAAFRAWMKRMGFTKIETARQLGITRASVRHWAREGRGAPPHITLACEALERRRTELSVEQQIESAKRVLDLARDLAVERQP